VVLVVHGVPPSGFKLSDAAPAWLRCFVGQN